jgi:chromosome segregation ATPase
MRSRDKILTLLFTVTLGLGTFILLYSNDDSLRRFRWLLLHQPLQLLADITLSVGSSTGLWYGGLSLVGMIMVGLALKMINSAEVRLFRERLVAAEVAKVELETLLQDSLWKEKHAREARDTAMKDLEAGSSRLVAAELKVAENENSLKSQDRELNALRSQVNALAGQRSEMGSAKDPVESALREELRKKAELVEVKNGAIKELERSLSEKVHALETHMSVKEKLLRERDQEVESLRSQLTRAGAAKSQAESFLTEELRKERQSLQAKESGMKELEKSFTARIQGLKGQLSEREELLQSRSAELEVLRFEVNALTRRLADGASAKERAADVLQQELKKKTELLLSKDGAFKKLETTLTARVHDLENQLNERDGSQRERDAELDALRAELSKAGSAKKKIEDSLQEELNKTTAALEVKTFTISELEQSLNKTVDALKHQTRQQEALLKSRDGELNALRSEVGTLKAQLNKQGSGSAWEALLQEERWKESASTTKELEEGLKKVRALQSLLGEKDDLLKIHEEKIERLESELKEKRTELARREIMVWQSIERRDLWKRRLAKFGIPLKD